MHNEFASKLSDISIGLTIKVGMSSPSLSPDWPRWTLIG